MDGEGESWGSTSLKIVCFSLHAIYNSVKINRRKQENEVESCEFSKTIFTPGRCLTASFYPNVSLRPPPSPSSSIVRFENFLRIIWHVYFIIYRIYNSGWHCFDKICLWGLTGTSLTTSVILFVQLDLQESVFFFSLNKNGTFFSAPRKFDFLFSSSFSYFFFPFLPSFFLPQIVVLIEF